MLEGLLPLATYCALMSGTPGPNNVMLAASGANFGYRRTLPHLLGINAGNFALTVLVCLGLGAVFARFPAIHTTMRIGGSLYLVYLAWRLAGAPAVQAAGSHRPLLFTEAAAFQAVNPKSWMKVATVATVFIPSGISPIYGALLVSTVQFAVGFPSNSVWALFGVAVRGFLGSPARLRMFNILMGLSLLALAIALLSQFE